MSTDHTHSSRPNSDTEPDVVSDPAHNDQTGSDWADEGGATPDGPATAADASQSDDENDENAETGADLKPQEGADAFETRSEALDAKPTRDDTRDEDIISLDAAD